MTIKKRLRSKSGFTLAETLLAVLILLLVSVIVANGIPVARNVYNNVIVGANAQMLLSTAVTALRNELGTAKEVNPNGTYVTYFNSERQAYSMISLNGTPATIQLDPYIIKPDGGDPTPIAGSKQRALVSDAASNKDLDLYITYKDVVRKKDTLTDKYVDDIIIFENLEVKNSKDSNSVITSIKELKIRLVPVADSEA